MALGECMLLGIYVLLFLMKFDEQIFRKIIIFFRK